MPRSASRSPNGTSLDVVEMDAASQRGIDDIRELRERVVLQPVEGRSKVYIVDEAHQLTDEAWNALLKLIEEPPPHLRLRLLHDRARRSVLPDRALALPDVRLPASATARGRDAACAASPTARASTRRTRRSSLIARTAGGSFRDAVSTLDQLAAATNSSIDRAVRAASSSARSTRRSLLRLCDTGRRSRHGRRAALPRGARGAGTGSRPARRSTCSSTCAQLLLVQHMGYVPESLPVTEETKERLREQANQLPEPTVLRLIDLLAVAVDDMRQGADPRLPLELALVKVTRPASDLSRESLAHRVELLESRAPNAAMHPAPAATSEPPREPELVAPAPE